MKNIPTLGTRLTMGLALSLGALAITTAADGADWRKFIPLGKGVEADPRAEYTLTEKHGPWLILCASFAGENAESEAQALVMELRKRYRLEAYKHRQSYDFSQPVVGRGFSRTGGVKIMKHSQDNKFSEIGVLVGHFQAVDSSDTSQALERIKHLQPDCLNLTGRKSSTQRFSGLRSVYRRISSSEDNRVKGPMGKAFVTRNPLIPKEYFAPKGIDSLVMRMNKGVKYSLLNNNSRYTVRVATFRGTSSFKPADAVKPLRVGNNPTKLEMAAENAHAMTMSLRKRGVQAWEFHDRYESIVTIGSFDSWGNDLPNGSIDINPAMLTIIETYKPVQRQVGSGFQGVQPRTENGIPFDIQPEPIEVPRVSIAADYARN
ncbi:MAG: hypothetical protein KDB14_13475 [Planctomycetales bacterium]|nr:hypothetical protein [Planctomycetales bacterium]